MKDLVISPILASLLFGGGSACTFGILSQEALKIDEEYFLDENEEWDAEQSKAFESLLPSEHRWKYGNTHHKKITLKEAKEKVEVLKDYSVLLSGCGAWGTGWFLDYVLPDVNKGERYPTRWFIGTGAHVATYFAFDVANPYNQLLPKTDDKCSSKNDDYGIVLGKEKPDVSKKTFNREKNFTDNVELISKLKSKDSEYDLEKKKDKITTKNGDRWWFWSKNPKLVYAPYNYLTKHSKNYSKHKYQFNDYAVDFAVFEVDFGDEKVAKMFTRNFYRKYNHVNGQKKDKALDFFAKPVADKYTNKQLLDNDVQVFGVGYPQKGISHTASSNYNIQYSSASRFSYYYVNNSNMSELKDSKGENLLGHIDMWLASKEGQDKNQMWNWAGRQMYMRGYGYVIEGNSLSTGASGGIFMTEDGGVLGTLSFGIVDSEQMLISALRNKEIKDKDGKVLYPAYDLIEGVEDQLISYKSQIQTYVLSQCRKTELSQLRGWKNIMAYDGINRRCERSSRSSK